MHSTPSSAESSLEDWWVDYRNRTRHLDHPADRVIAGVGHADRLGWAFVAGYDGAMKQLAPHLGADERVSLCATEAHGVHPSTISTAAIETDEGYEIIGDKIWSTLSDRADSMLVLVTTGRDGDRNLLRMAHVRAADTRRELMPETPFCPEIRHCEIRFDAVRVDALLPGDGWTDWIRPFRTIEDQFVALATAVYVSRFGLDTAALVAALRELIDADRDAPQTHLLLNDAFVTLRRLLVDIDWAGVAPDERARFERDIPLLDIAERARIKRTQRAREQLEQ